MLNFNSLIKFTVFAYTLIGINFSNTQDSYASTTDSVLQEKSLTSNDVNSKKNANKDTSKQEKEPQEATSAEEQEASPTTTAESNSKNSAQLIEEAKDALIKIFNNIDFTLESIIFYLNEIDINPDKKDSLVNNILSLRKTIARNIISMKLYTDITLLNQAVNCIKAMQNHIQIALKEKLAVFPLFDEDMTTKRLTPTQSAEEIKNNANKLTKELEDLKNSVESSGLHIGNKLYRTLIDAPFTWCSERHLGTYASWTIATLLTGLYIAYRFNDSVDGLQVPNPAQPDNRTLKEKTIQFFPGSIYTGPDYVAKTKAINSALELNETISGVVIPPTDPIYKRWNGYVNNFIHDFIGRPVTNRTVGDNNSDYEKLFEVGILGKAENFMFSINSGHAALGLIMLPHFQSLYKDQISMKLTNWKNYIYSWHLRFKGGIYKKQAEKITDEFNLYPKGDLSNIVGYDETKDFMEDLAKYLANPKKFNGLGTPPHKGILLYGPPGTGKTEMVRAFAGQVVKELKSNNLNENKFKFLNINAKQILEFGFDRILYYAQHYAPCVIFIDEIDLLKMQRSGDGNSEALSTALAALSGFLSESNIEKPVIIIGATNRPENLDAALTRPGRLSKKFYFGFPSYKTRLEFLIRTVGNKVDPEQFDLARIAQQTSGYTLEHLRTVINTAIFRSRSKGSALTQKDLDDAFNSEIRNILTKVEDDLSKEEEYRLAIHMAGHAVAQIIMQENSEINSTLSTVTINPITEKIKEVAISENYKSLSPAAGKAYGKMFTYVHNDSIKGQTSATLKAECSVLLAGRVAEKMLLNSVGSNNNKLCSGSCKNNAYVMAEEIMLDGISKNLLSEHLKIDLAQKSHALLKEIEEKIQKKLSNYSHLIVTISDLLVERKTVSYEEIAHAIKNQHMQADTVIQPKA